jgi:hypothetical protein
MSEMGGGILASICLSEKEFRAQMNICSPGEIGQIGANSGQEYGPGENERGRLNPGEPRKTGAR